MIFFLFVDYYIFLCVVLFRDELDFLMAGFDRGKLLY